MGVDLPALTIKALYGYLTIDDGDDLLAVIAVAEAALAFIANREQWDAALDMRDPLNLDEIEDAYLPLLDALRETVARLEAPDGT